MDYAAPFLHPWSNFYEMTGSSAATLTGLTFVMVTLINRAARQTVAQDGISTFSTPTVMHFCEALFVSAVLLAPWHLLVHPAFLTACTGAYGIIYIARITLRARRFTQYTPDLEDWTWYNALPFIAYAVILGGAIALPVAPVIALFLLAGSVVLLLFIGIRNAWDVVTYLVISRADELRQAEGTTQTEEQSDQA